MRIARPAALAFVALAILSPAPAASAADPGSAISTARSDVDDFVFESFHADYLLARDDAGYATLEVVETIVAVFPDFDQNRGFYRDIPEYYNDRQLHTEVLSVTDETGEPVPYFTEYYEDFYSVGLGDDSFVRGEQTYVIHYLQRNTIQYFADPGIDEFAWDVNGTGWAQPFAEVSATLRVEAGIAAQLTGQAACFAGAVWESSACDSGIAGRVDAETGETVFEVSHGPLAPYENLTLAVAFAPNTFVEGPVTYPPSSYGGGYEPPPPSPWWLDLAIFALGPVGILLGIIARVTHRKDEGARTRASDIIVPQYTVPEVNIMLAAHVSGQAERAFAAQIVSLAVRGRIRLVDEPSEPKGDYLVEFVSDEGCDPYELSLLQAMFGKERTAGERFTLDRGDTKFGAAFEKLRQRLIGDVKGQGYSAGTRVRPQSVALMVAGGVTVVGGGALVLDAMTNYGQEVPLLAAGAAGWGALQTLTRASSRRVLTEKGEKLNDHLLGMKDYLELAEAERFRVLQSETGAERVRIDDQSELVKLYEKLLPWAVLWGVEKSWGEVLVAAAAAAQVPITWVSNPYSLSGWRLHSVMSGISRGTPAPPVVARASSGGSVGRGWSSSGGSSSFSSFSSGGGGGFSGGGGGGGGGRGR